MAEAGIEVARHLPEHREGVVFSPFDARPKFLYDAAADGMRKDEESRPQAAVPIQERNGICTQIDIGIEIEAPLVLREQAVRQQFMEAVAFRVAGAGEVDLPAAPGRRYVRLVGEDHEVAVRGLLRRWHEQLVIIAE